MTHVLDNPAFAALTGPQASFAERSGDAARFFADISPFGGIRAEDAASWADAATLVGPGGIAWFVALAGPPPEPGLGPFCRARWNWAAISASGAKAP
jgi:hypothetical protein